MKRQIADYPDSRKMDAKSTVQEMRVLVRKMRREIIALEQEVGKQCETIQSLQSELKLLRKE